MTVFVLPFSVTSLRGGDAEFGRGGLFEGPPFCPISLVHLLNGKVASFDGSVPSLRGR